MQQLVDIILHTSPLLIYIIVAVTLLLESAGIPITNNTLLLLTGALASLGHLNIWLLTIVAIIGSIAGACSAYLLGRWRGQPILLRMASLFRVDAAKVHIAENWFQRSGVWMIFLSRMTPYVRPFACFPAGISRMFFLRFVIAALAGSIIWCIALVRIGAALGPHWRIALTLMQNYTLPTCAGLILLLVLYILVSIRIRQKLRGSFREQATVNSEQDESAEIEHNLLEV